MNTTLYDGNATEYDWTLDKGNIINTNTSGGELALLLTESNGGTRLSSTRYIHYGTVTTRRESFALPSKISVLTDLGVLAKQ